MAVYWLYDCDTLKYLEYIYGRPLIIRWYHIRIPESYSIEAYWLYDESTLEYQDDIYGSLLIMRW